MDIRPYRPPDCPEMAQLFYNTVHIINARDYTPRQLGAWATGTVDLSAWDRSFRAHRTLVAEEAGILVGFGDMDETGYLDRLYVHPDYQSQGIAAAICQRLEQAVQVRKVTTHASITAKPFFLHRGYRVLREQQVIRGGIALTNYVMEKELQPAWGAEAGVSLP